MIRLATPEDVGLLASLHASAFPDPWQTAAIAKLLMPPAGLGIVSDTEAFGLFQLVKGEAEVLTLATHPEHRRKGHARAIIMHSQTLATRVFLDVATNNHAAISLYQSLGFVIARTRKAYYTDGSDALVMRWEA